ncbi:hypothetical protein D3C78_562190 [compost metagenome]
MAHPGRVCLQPGAVKPQLIAGQPVTAGGEIQQAAEVVDLLAALARHVPHQLGGGLAGIGDHHGQARLADVTVELHHRQAVVNAGIDVIAVAAGGNNQPIHLTADQVVHHPLLEGGIILGAGDQQLDARLPAVGLEGARYAGKPEVGEIGDHQPPGVAAGLAQGAGMKARLVVALIRHRLDPLAGIVGNPVLRTLPVKHQTGGRLGHPRQFGYLGNSDPFLLLHLASRLTSTGLLY